MRTLPEILNQSGSPECSSYSVAGVANFLLSQAKLTDRVDPIKLYKEETQVGGNTLGAILAKSQINGLPLLSGKRIKVKSYARIIPGAINARNEVAKAPLAFTYQIGNGSGLWVKPPDYTMTWPLDTHSMVICDYDAMTQRFYCANSYGSSWGEKGYFYIPAMYMVSPYCVDLYSMNIDI